MARMLYPAIIAYGTDKASAPLVSAWGTHVGIYLDPELTEPADISLTRDGLSEPQSRLTVTEGSTTPDFYGPEGYSGPLYAPGLNGEPELIEPSVGELVTAERIRAIAAEELLVGEAGEGAAALVDAAVEELTTVIEADQATAAALAVTVAGKLAKASNLSDLANVVTARANLGLGSAALVAIAAFDPAGAAAAVEAAAAIDATAKVAAEAVARQAAIDDLIDSAPGTYDTLGEIAAALQDDQSGLAALVTVVASKAPLASPALTGAPTINGVAAETTAGALAKAAAAQAAAIASSLQIAANLADVANAATARGNLGLGTAATHAHGDYEIAGAAAAVLATSLQKAANLSDLVNAATARGNLGLGTAAVHDHGDYDLAGAAAAAQAGAIALSLQRASNLSDLANAGTARTNLGLGSAATHAHGDYEVAGAAAAAQAGAIALSLQRASNLSDLANAGTARTNLGLGSAATHAHGDYDAAGAAAAVLAASLQKASNLSDLANAGTARTNLGLGSAATVNTGTTSGTLPLLDASGWVARAQLPSAVAYQDSATTFTSPAAGTVPLTTKGAASQSADLHQWLSSASAVLAKVNSIGIFYGLSFATLNYTGTSTALGIAAPSSTVTPAVIKGAASQSADLLRWENSAATLLAKVRSDGWLMNPGVTNTLDTGPYLATSATGFTLANRGATSNVPLVVQGLASQSGDLLQFQNSAAANLGSISADGNQLALGANQTVSGLARVTLAGRARWDYNNGVVHFDDGATGANKPLVMQFGTTSAVGVTIQPNTASTIPLAVQGTTSQTGDLQRWQTVTPTVLSKVTIRGEFENAVAAVAASDIGGGTGGIVLRSPDGTRWRVTVSNLGVLTVTAA